MVAPAGCAAGQGLGGAPRTAAVCACTAATKITAHKLARLQRIKARTFIDMHFS
jgi:hypothetical protein